MKWMHGIAALVLVAALPLMALAQSAARVELNALSQEGAACRLTFTLRAEAGLAALETQTVLFDAAGNVLSFSLFDFGAVPDGGLRVRQFDVPSTACEGLGLVLFNGIERCEAAAGGPCDAAPQFSSRLDALEVQQ